MKSFKQLLSEVAQPKSEDELNFKDKHEIEMMDHPESEEHQHTSDKPKAKRLADYKTGEDMTVYEKKMDPVNPKELEGDFEDREDKDIDNDGKVDDSDRYLHNRRKAISKAMKNESKMSDEDVLDAAKALAKNGKDAKTRNFGRGLVNFHKKEGSFTPAQVGGLQNIMKNASFQMAKESVELDESFSVFKPMSPAPGKSVSNRAQVKAFKTSDQMNTFLAKGGNSLHWKPTGKEGLKSGTYKMDMKRGSDGKPARDFIRENNTLESAFIAKAAAAKKAKKDNFELGDKKFPVTIKKSTADKIIEKKEYAPGRIGDIQRMLDKEREAKKESVELDEISSKTLTSYIDKASDSRSHKGLSTKKVDNRYSGVKMAGNKLRKASNESFDLSENFKTGSLTLDDGSKVVINKQDADKLNSMFDELNAQNRNKMMATAMKNKSGFNEILGFAKEAL
jgi:hypothetical protein